MDFRLIISKGLKYILNPPALRNCSVDSTSKVCAKSELSKVTIGRYSYVGNDCFMVKVHMGSFCSIADRCCIGGARHPIERVSTSPVFHEGNNVMKKNFQYFQLDEMPLTVIENDVWIGIGSIIKSGVTIHNGAVIGAGSVVTHDVPPYEIWAGNPAHRIRKRFDDDTIEKLLKIGWWNFKDKKIAKISNSFDNIDAFIKECGL